MSKFGWTLGWMLASAIVVAACSGESNDGDTKNAAGSSGQAGQTAQGGDAGQAGDVGSNDCREYADCKAFGDCSALSDLVVACDYSELTSFETKCGGLYIESKEGVTASSWTFDAKGKLIAGTSEDEGGCSYWGSSACPSIGTGDSFCGSSQCVSHTSCDIWGANIDCPAMLGDVDALCRLGELTIERYASDCGGTYVEASNGIQTSEWTFDASDKLVGAASIGDVGDCDNWGTRCNPVGAPELLCGAAGQGGAGGQAGAGGQGGGGQGGAGGVPASQ